MAVVETKRAWKSAQNDYKYDSPRRLPFEKAGCISTASKTLVSSILSWKMEEEILGLNRQEHQIGPYDIKYGRHRDAFNNVGNRRFRITISLNIERYLAASTRREKAEVIGSIIELVEGNGGYFLKWSVQRQDWIALNSKQARAKVGHAMRDMITARDSLAAENGAYSFVE